MATTFIVYFLEFAATYSPAEIWITARTNLIFFLHKVIVLGII